MIRENESLVKENERLKHEKQALFKSKEMTDARVMALQKDIKEKENLVGCCCYYCYCYDSSIHALQLFILKYCVSGPKLKAISGWTEERSE